jgi:hypothetical protein
MNKYWSGPLDSCDLCKKDFFGVMYDASVPAWGGRWGNICNNCYIKEGCSLGIGRGQKYEQQTDGRWLKTGG